MKVITDRKKWLRSTRGKALEGVYCNRGGVVGNLSEGQETEGRQGEREPLRGDEGDIR